MFWDKDSNEKTKNIYGIFLCKFLKKYIYFWIQKFYFWRKQKYLWKRFYNIKKPLKNRARERQRSCIQLCCHFAREWPKLHFFYIRLKQNNRLLKKFTIQLPTVDWATIKFSTILGVVLTKLWYCSSLYGSSKNMGTI